MISTATTMVDFFLAALLLVRFTCYSAHSSLEAFGGQRSRYIVLVLAMVAILGAAFSISIDLPHADTLLLAAVALLFFADRRGPFRGGKPRSE